MMAPLEWLPQARLALGFACALALGVCAAWLLWRRFGARVYGRELALEMTHPFALGGRPDLIMQEWGGLLVAHDLKTRKSDRVYDSDRLQLELYALLIRQATGRKVAPWAVVRVSVDGRVRPHRVELRASSQELSALAQRYRAACVSPLSARMSAQPWMCSRCGFRGKECPGKAGAKAKR